MVSFYSIKNLLYLQGHTKYQLLKDNFDYLIQCLFVNFIVIYHLYKDKGSKINKELTDQGIRIIK